jgi:hypothetical protein
MAGSRVKIDKGSALQLKRLGYSGGRVRLFDLKRGRMRAKVQSLRGKRGRYEIACNGLRIKVRGTDFDVQATQSGALVTAMSGEVSVDSGVAQENVEQGTQLKAFAERELADPTEISEEQKQSLLKELDLNDDPGALERFSDLLGDLEEVTLVPVMLKAQSLASMNPEEMVGTIRGATALAKAQVAMQAITTSLLTAGDGDIPESLTLTTLEELGMKEEDRKNLLSCFEGNKLESYKRLGADSYELYARVADAKHTLIRARDGKVVIVKEDSGY